MQDALEGPVACAREIMRNHLEGIGPLWELLLARNIATE